MTMHKLFYLPLAMLLFFDVSKGLAQEQIHLPMPDVPLTPEASSFLKYGDLAVSGALGLPQIEVPIYNLEYRGFQLPIKLTYYAGGFKVQEIGSDIGMGWTLVGQGLISQTIRGLRDEFNGSSGYATKTEIIEMIDYDNATNGSGSYRVCATGDNCSVGQLVNINRKPENQDQIYFGQVDAEPDLFSFNAPGLSGTFYIDKSGNPVVQRSSNIRVIRTVFDGFTITNEKGVKYIFSEDDKETLQFDTNCQEASMHFTPRQLDNYSNNYHLTQICLPQGGCINYTYSDYSYKYTDGITQVDNHPGTISTCYNTTTIVTGKKLEAITTDDGITIDFIYDSSQRPDLPAAEPGLPSGKLNEIRVINNAEVVSTHLLTHETQFGASNPFISSYLNSGDIDLNNNARLLLKSVKKGIDNPYKFKYYGDDDVSMRMPSRFSFARDAWGYFNGALDNESIVPAYVLGGSGGMISLGNANREPDPQKMKAGVLKSITYPLGGETRFSYEAHNREIDLVNEGGCTEIIVPGSVELSSTGDEGPKSVDFTITDDIFDIWVDYQTNVPEQYTGGLDPGFGEPSSLCNIQDLNTPGPEAIEIFDRSIIKPLSIPTSDYRINLRTSGFIDELDESMNPVPAHTTIKVSWKKRQLFCSDDQPLTTKIYYGGLRVKSIFSEPNDPEAPAGTYSIQKDYEYHDMNVQTDFYQGQLFSYNFFYSPSYRVSGSSCGTDTYFTSTGDQYELVHTVSSESVVPGYNVIGYGKIDEFKVDYAASVQVVVPEPEAKNYFGKTSYFYDYFANVITANNMGPTVYSENDFSFVSGDLIRTDEFVFDRFTDTFEPTYELKKQTIYNYTTFDSNADPHYQEIWGLRVKRSHPAAIFYGGAQCFSVVPLYSSAFYKTMSIWKRLDGVTERYFDGNTLDKVESYAYNGQRQLVRKTHDIDAQTTIQEQYFYPTAFTTEEPVYASMVANNLRDVPIFTLTTSTHLQDLTTKLTGLVQYVYSEDAPGKYLLNQAKQGVVTDQSGVPVTYSELLSTVNNGNYRNTIFRYDANDRVIETEKEGFVTGYVRSQEGRRVIATVQNAHERDIFYTGFEDDTGNTFSAKIGNKALTAAGSFTIPKSFTNTADLVMSYWGFDGSAWHFSGELPFSPQITGSFSIIDEVRVYPLGAQMTTYNYKTGTVVRAVTDPNNVTTSYQYDDNLRLTEIHDQDGNLLKFIEYNQRPQN